MSFGCHRFSKKNNEKIALESNDYMGYLMSYSAFIFWFDLILNSGAEICQIFRWFFEKSVTPKRHSEINWPLEEKVFILFKELCKPFLFEELSCLILNYPIVTSSNARWIRKSSFCQKVKVHKDRKSPSLAIWKTCMCF